MTALPTVMIAGIGHLGGPLLDALARSRRIGRVVALSRDPEWGRARCNLAALSAAAAGGAPRVEHRSADVSVAEQVHDAVIDVAPQVLLHAASLQTWWLPDLFPERQRVALRGSGFGAWLPLHLALALSLVEGTAAAGYRGVLLNAAYPDVINVVLARVGLPVAAGVGNVDELVAKLRMRVAAKIGAAPDELDIWLVAHHALQARAFAAASEPTTDLETSPFHLRVERDGRDVSDESEAVGELLGPCPLPAGPGWGTFTAASAVALVEAVVADSPSRLHAPGPEGLPGGYPVQVANGAVTVSPIPGLTREQAISINERSHRFDGIDHISEDGTVVFTDAAAAAMRETLGYDCEQLRPVDAAARAAELASRFAEYARRYGVEIPVSGGPAAASNGGPFRRQENRCRD